MSNPSSKSKEGKVQGSKAPIVNRTPPPTPKKSTVSPKK